MRLKKYLFQLDEILTISQLMENKMILVFQELNFHEIFLFHNLASH